MAWIRPKPDPFTPLAIAKPSFHGINRHLEFYLPLIFYIQSSGLVWLISGVEKVEVKLHTFIMEKLSFGPWCETSM